MREVFNVEFILMVFLLVIGVAQVVDGQDDIGKSQILGGRTYGSNFEYLNDWELSDTNVPYFGTSSTHQIQLSSTDNWLTTDRIIEVRTEDGSTDEYIRVQNPGTSALVGSRFAFAPQGLQVVKSIENSNDILSAKNIPDNIVDTDRSTGAFILKSDRGSTDNLAMFIDREGPQYESKPIPYIGSGGWGRSMKINWQDRAENSLYQTYNLREGAPFAIADGFDIDFYDYDLIGFSLILDGNSFYEAFHQTILNDASLTLGAWVNSDVARDYRVQKINFEIIKGDGSDVEYANSLIQSVDQGYHPEYYYFNSTEKSYYGLPPWSVAQISDELHDWDNHGAKFGLEWMGMDRDDDMFVAIHFVFRTRSGEHIGINENIYFDAALLAPKETTHSVEFSARSPILNDTARYILAACLYPNNFTTEEHEPYVGSASDGVRNTAACNGIEIDSFYGSRIIDAEGNTIRTLNTSNILADNEWHHFVFSFEWSNSTSINYTAYINGTIYSGFFSPAQPILEHEFYGVYMDMWIPDQATCAAFISGGEETCFLDLDNIYFNDRYYDEETLDVRIKFKESSNELLVLIAIAFGLILISVVIVVASRMFSDGGV